MVKNSPANARDAGSIPGSGRSPGEGNGNPLQCSCLENYTTNKKKKKKERKLHGQRSLAGHSPCGCKESDTTEHA